MSLNSTRANVIADFPKHVTFRMYPVLS